MTLDMTPQFGAPCKSAKRALALTENRTAVVLRDEMTFKRPANPVWVATPETQDITLAEGGRAAYLKKTRVDGTEKLLRVTLLSKNEDLRFEILGADALLIPTTITRKNSANDRASDSPVRLCVRADGVKKFDLSVAFEIVDSMEGKTALREKTIAKW